MLKAFHDWYDSASVLFSQYFDGEEYYVKFASEDTSGNQYVLSHVFDRIRAPYKVMMNKLKSGDIPVRNSRGQENEQTNSPFVFISHASVDEAILQLFKTHILKFGLGLTDDQIAYTSDEASGVPAGDNIPQFIKNGIGRAQVVLFMISEGYKASEVCLNEMGAAWALDIHTVSVLLPGVSFDKLGWLTSLDKAIKIDDRTKLANLAEVICKETGISKPKLTTWDVAVANFLSSIKDLDVQSTSRAEDEPYVSFEDGTNVLEVEVPYISTSYISQSGQSLQSRRQLDFATLTGGSMNIAQIVSRQACEVKAKPTISVGGVKANLSMVDVHLKMHVPSKSIENVSVLIKGENLRFDSDNKSRGIFTKLLQPGKIIKDDGCDFTMGTCNAEMMYSLPMFYVEPKDICGEIDGYPDESAREYKLLYTISTKDQPYSGDLFLRITTDAINFV